MRTTLVILAALAVHAGLAAEPSQDNAPESKSMPRIFSDTPSPSSRSSTSGTPSSRSSTSGTSARRSSTPASRPTSSRATGKPAKYVPPPFTVTLPSGTELTQTLMEPPRNWIDRMFPDDDQVYVEKFTDGKIRGVYCYAQGKLNGGAVTLYADGGVSTLANYEMSQREGPLRRWEESKKRLLYAEYKRDKQTGLICLFRDDLPWFVQEYDRSDVPTEYLVKWSGGKGEAIPHNRLPPEDLRETAAARDKIRDLESELQRSEDGLKQALRDLMREKIKEARRKRAAKPTSARKEELHKKQPAAQKPPHKNEKNPWRVALRATGL
jgi:hypothetical protein